MIIDEILLLKMMNHKPETSVVAAAVTAKQKVITSNKGTPKRKIAFSGVEYILIEPNNVLPMNAEKGKKCVKA